MLVLSRRLGESVMIGQNVKVTVLGVKGMEVRIGIDAPKDIEVHREEVFERVQAERARSRPLTASLGSHLAARG